MIFWLLINWMLTYRPTSHSVRLTLEAGSECVSVQEKMWNGSNGAFLSLLTSVCSLECWGWQLAVGWCASLFRIPSLPCGRQGLFTPAIKHTHTHTCSLPCPGYLGALWVQSLNLLSFHCTATDCFKPCMSPFLSPSLGANFSLQTSIKIWWGVSGAML